MPERLTAQQQTVLRLVAEGLSNKEIARALGLSPWTVKRHVAEILGKVGVTSRLQAAIYAVHAGLV